MDRPHDETVRDGHVPEPPPASRGSPPGLGPRRLAEVGWAFLRLGCLSFGGPIAHLGYLRTEFVQRRRWLEEAAYADLVALCQFLPGPASSQLVFALGFRRAGLAGALLASLCFTLPSAVLMIAFALGVGRLDPQAGHEGAALAGWLHGLKLAAVAVVAQAVWGMGRVLCPDRPRLTIGLASAAMLLLLPGAAVQLGVIAAGALLGWILFRHGVRTTPPADHPPRIRHVTAGLVLSVFLVLLLVLPLLAAATGSRRLAVFDAFYRSGSLVFGGGHVLLPMLRAEVVPPGWVTDAQFLAGYGAAQAVPGPLFTFAGYLGTIIEGGPHAWLGGLWCLLALFLPTWLLIGGALPFWDRWRTQRWAQACLQGANAAVVGVLLAALYHPVMTSSLAGPRDMAAALVGFGALHWWRVPPWAVVLAMAGAGQWVV
jgi:chromate transporter